MKKMILAAATLLMAILILRQQENNILWEIHRAEEAYQSAALLHEELTVEAEKERRVLTRRQREQLDNFLQEQEGGWSVYLLDITSGENYLYNEEAYYYPASLLKAPYAYWLALKADEGELNFARRIPNCKYGALAGGDMEKYNTAQTIPVIAVIRSMIAYSNNDAVTILANQWAGTAQNGFTDFLKGLGYTYAETVRIDGWEGIQGMMTVKDIGATMKALYDYFETESSNAYNLKRCFLTSGHEVLYTPEKVPTAKKYGSWQYAYHDAAIVYGKYPYVLCVMSDRGLETVDFPEEPTQTMQELGKLVWTMLEE